MTSLARRAFAISSIALLCLGCSQAGGEASEIPISCELSLSASEIAQLQTLTVRGCGDTDVRPLGAAKALRELVIDDPDLTDIRRLAALRSLEVLHLRRSHVADISPVGPLERLREIVVLDTPLTNLEPLRRNTALEHVDISDTYVLDLSPLVELPRLRTLEAARARIGSLAPLAAMTALRRANLSGNGVSDVRPLLDHSAPEGLHVDLTGNCITASEPDQAAALDELEARGMAVYVGAQAKTCAPDSYFRR